MGRSHLSIGEREVIMKMRAQNCSRREIGRYLGRSGGTISRELRRNLDSQGEYRPHLAQRYHRRRRQQSKTPYRLEEDVCLEMFVRNQLEQYWSPEQISGWLRKKVKQRLSPGTIYSYIRRERRAGGKMWKYLRQSHRRRRKRYGGADRRRLPPDRRMIDQRPAVANQRKRLGDWESDTMEGAKGKGLLASHVDRKSRYTALVKLADKSADELTAGTVKKLGQLPAEKLKTMTPDNGTEFAGYKELEQRLGLRSYFAHPYHSWERGTNENTNGLLRQFFPKGTDFTQVPDSEIDRVERLLNNRPRKCLNYRTPMEVFWPTPKCCASD